MLIQFTVENYRSFRERTVFSMRKASNVERGDDAPDVVKGTDILRCAAMYGANASGKSNFVEALRFAQHLIVIGVNKHVRIRNHPFRLDATASAASSNFEFYLRAASGRVYAYGFSLQSGVVLREWMSEVVDGDELEIFSREASDFEFAPQGERAADELLELVGSATKDNQLFLRTVQGFKRESFPQAFGDVWTWFAESLEIVTPDATYATLIADADRDEAFRIFLGEILQRADTGITGVRTVRREVSRREKEHLEDFGADDREEHLDESGRRVLYKAEGDKWYRVELRLQHVGDEAGGASEFELQDESDGTVRLLDLSPMLFHKERPVVFIVDELDRSVHTALTRWMIERFVSEGADTESQLIFTTHDTNIFDVSVLRPDAFWFAEKDKSGASTLYSLAEFKAEQIAELRSDLERAYLVGRFGGVPRIRGAETP